MLPSKRIDHYCSRIEELSNTFEIHCAAAIKRPQEKELIRSAAGQLLVACGLRVEKCLHDTIVLAFVAFPDEHKRNIIGKVQQSIESKFGVEVSKSLKITWTVGAITEEMATKYLDKDGKNLTFGGCANFVSQLVAIGGPKLASFKLATDDLYTMDLVVQCRHYFAHESTYAKSELIARLKAVPISPRLSFLKLSNIDIDKYFVARKGVDMRAKKLATELVISLRQIESQLHAAGF